MSKFPFLLYSFLFLFIGCQREIPLPIIHTDSESQSPVVTIKVYFKTGSADDPAGKKGLNNLTAALMSGSRTESLTHSQIRNFLFPIAADITYSSEKEVTVFTGTVHKDHLKSFLPIFLSKIFHPMFTQEDLDRNRDYTINYLSEQLPNRNDEDLSKIGLEYLMFDDHAYQFPPEGKVSDLYRIGLDDVVSYHQSILAKDNIYLGLAGSVSEEDMKIISDVLNDVSLGETFLKSNRFVKRKNQNTSILFIENNSASVSMSFGIPLDLTRRDRDFYSLMIANSYLGEHRTFHGLLMNEIRTKRGLNYGDYSYIEHWIEDAADQPYGSAHHVRLQQYFSVWLRTTERENAPFVLKTALSVFDQLIENGLTEEEFELTKSYLINYSKLWTQTQERRLAFRMDSEFYNMVDFIPTIDSVMNSLTVQDVNSAIKKYFTGKPIYISIVGANAEELKTLFLSVEPTIPVYLSNNIMGKELKEEDARISQRLLIADSVRVIRAEELFEE